jgi:hypothetical protein
LKRSIQAAALSLPGIKKAMVDLVDTLALKAGEELATGAGTGITTGTGTVYQSSVTENGGIITTRILLDLTGLHSADSDLDVIGVEDTALPCHFGQITDAENGSVFGGTIQCLEAPLSLTDLGIYADGDGTLVYEDAIATAGDGETLIVTPAVQAVSDGAVPIAGVPPANSYLYVVNGAADTPDIFTAGKFLIELLGYRA